MTYMHSLQPLFDELWRSPAETQKEGRPQTRPTLLGEPICVARNPRLLTAETLHAGLGVPPVAQLGDVSADVLAAGVEGGLLTLVQR